MALSATPFPSESVCNFSLCGAGMVSNATGSVALAGLVALLATVPVVEYYHAGFDHFVTADPDEINALDAGAFGGAWVRTGGSFRAFASSISGGVPVCRFFSAAFAPKSSHFYTPNAAECASLKSNPMWIYGNRVLYDPPDRRGCVRRRHDQSLSAVQQQPRRAQSSLHQ